MLKDKIILALLEGQGSSFKYPGQIDQELLFEDLLLKVTRKGDDASVVQIGGNAVNFNITTTVVVNTTSLIPQSDGTEKIHYQEELIDVDLANKIKRSADKYVIKTTMLFE